MNEAGIYVHYPFCERLCPYCDFAVKVKKVIPEEQYTTAVLNEIKKSSKEWSHFKFKTLYLGGGTPSLWSGFGLGRLFEGLDSRFDLCLDEITIEANPKDIQTENLEKWSTLGIGRVSLGVQSFSDVYLKKLGRNHNGEDAKQALEKLNRYGFSISADLIFAGPGQTLEEFSSDLEIMGDYVDHISAYALTIEENTVFWKQKKAGILALPTDEIEDAFFDLRDEKLSRIGFARYEVSSFSRGVEHQANHNSGYWLGRPYLGLGIGAHSMLRTPTQIQRRANTRSLKKYYEEPEKYREVEIVSAQDHAFERMFLAARTRFWFSPKEILSSFASLGDDFVIACESVFNRFSEVHIERAGDSYRLTSRGLDISDSIGKALAEKIR